jgi:ketosteroid isomerase-like protein
MPTAPPTGTCRDFDGVVTGYRQALQQFMTGDPTAAGAFYSSREDVTLANPLGPPHRGPAAVAAGLAHGAAQLRDGRVSSIEEVSRYRTADLGYVVQIERSQARIPGGTDVVTFALRVTMVFRREGDTWTVAHRHADPITSPRPITSAVEA